MTQSWGGFLFIKMKNNERSLTDQVNDFENQFHRYGLENLKTGSAYSVISLMQTGRSFLRIIMNAIIVLVFILSYVK